jgi:multiple sugar transport system substrate-binding protein
MRTSLFKLFAGLALIALLAGACATPTPEVVVQTQVVKETQVVVETQVVTETQIVQATAEPMTDRVQIYWYIGLGAGAQPAQIPLEKEFVEKYNASQDEIQLITIIVDNKYARDNLTAQIAAGNAPDIVGPLGTAGRAAFPGAFLDLQPLIEQFNYDTSDIDPAFLDFYKDEGVLVGLPFAIFPEFVYFNRALFDEAGLNYPPQEYGAKYVMPDGTEVDWDFNTVAEVAKLLTVDANGNDATQPGFDPENIVQWGYLPQWSEHPRAVGSLFGAFYPVDDEGNASIPDTAVEAWKWYYDGMWAEQPFIPTQAAIDGDLLKGNPFSSGKIGMATTHLWYTCCIDAELVPNWDIAAMPAYEGTVTSKMHGDTFALLAASAHPEEAFKVYTYMLGEGAADLYAIYGGLPARTSQQQAFFDGLTDKFAPNEVNWQVAIDSIPYMDVPNHELGTPNYAKSFDLFSTLGSDFRSNPDLDLDARIATFIEELNGVLHEEE